ncbi:unnamed protein product, partial [Heterosigma akashiwo]
MVNERHQVLFKEFVKPEGRVTDYMTWVTGVEPDYLRNAPSSLQELLPSIRRLLQGRTIIGHSVETDLEYLGIKHLTTHQICDVADFPSFRGARSQRRKLKDLAREYLGESIQEGPHDPEEDAWAAMELYKKF